MLMPDLPQIPNDTTPPSWSLPGRRDVLRLLRYDFEQLASLASPH